jgi:hypothetical protein
MSPSTAACNEFRKSVAVEETNPPFPRIRGGNLAAMIPIEMNFELLSLKPTIHPRVGPGLSGRPVKGRRMIADRIAGNDSDRSRRFGRGMPVNHSAAGSGVSQETEAMDAASGGELDWSPVSGDPSRLCRKPCPSYFYSSLKNS